MIQKYSNILSSNNAGYNVPYTLRWSNVTFIMLQVKHGITNNFTPLKMTLPGHIYVYVFIYTYI